jgi:Tfp pilus assembly protein PilO
MRDAWKAPGLGLVALVVVVLGVGVGPSAVRARDIGQQIAAAEAELAKPNGGPELIVSLEQELAQLRELADGGMTPIPPDADVAGLIGRLSRMFDDAQLGEREVTTGQPAQLDEASALPMSVSVQGPFPSILGVLMRIESLDRLVRIERLRLTGLHSRKGPVDRSGEVRASVQVEVFYAPRDVTAGAPGRGAEGKRP